jgi:hypothetical protein
MVQPIAGILETIIDGSTTTVIGTAYQARPLNRCFICFIRGSGSVTATVLLECSMDGINFATRQSVTLSGANGYASFAYNDALSPFPFVRASVSAISGTSAAVTVQMAGSNP